MTLFASQHHRAVFNHPALLAAQDACEARARDLRMFFETGQFQIRRSQIAHIDEILDHTAGLDPLPPAHRQRQMITIFINLPLHPRKRHPVVGGDHNQRVVQASTLFQHLQNTPDLRIRPLHLDGVIRQIAAHHFIVRQIARHLHIAEFFAQTHAAALFVSTMWFLEATPEAKRRVRLHRRHEVGEIRCVIRGLNAFGRHGHLVRIKRRPRWISRAALQLKFPRSPTFSGQSDRVTALFEQIGIHREFRREDAAVTNRLLELPGVPSGQNRRSARTALRIRGERILKQHTLTRHTVKIRRFHPITAVSTRMLPSPVVKDDEQDVRSRCDLFRRGESRPGTPTD